MTMLHNMMKRGLAGVAGFALAVAAPLGADGAPDSRERSKPGQDSDSWGHEFGDWVRDKNLGRLYKNKKGWINEWSLLGRLDLQYGGVDSDHGDADDFELRRLRLGTSVEFLDDWRLKLVAEMGDGDRVAYDGLLSASLRYSLSKNFKIKLGKQIPHFSQEWSTPSMDLGVIERSLLVEQVRPGRATGITAKGEWEALGYELGLFSGDKSQEFSQFDAGWFGVLGLGYDLTDHDAFDWWSDFDLRFYYLYNDGHDANEAAKPYEHSYAAALSLRKKRFRLQAEVIAADGLDGAPDAWGFLVTPSWELIEDKLDLVFRYHYAESDGDGGLRLRSRYERLAPRVTDRGRGEEYHSVYLGLKLHTIEDRLVFLSGLEWSEMQDHVGDGGDYDGLTFLNALRFDF